MGVSGCGKTTVGGALAARLGWPFEEGDRYHLPANVAKMAARHPAEDADRWPWLEKLAALIGGHEAAGQSSVLACSALKRAYRDLLRTGAPRVRFVHLHGAREVLAGAARGAQGALLPARPPRLAVRHARAARARRGRLRRRRGAATEAQVEAALRGLGLG